MAFKSSSVIIFLILGTSSAFLMNSPTPSATSINSASTFQQIIKLFNDERHKLEVYVASKEQAFNAREFALEQKINKTIDELAKATSELNKEKAKIIKVEQDVDQLTMQIFNLTTNNNKLKANIRGLELRNTALENKLTEINRNQTLIFKGLEAQNLGLETKLNELTTNQTLKYLALESKIDTMEAHYSALKKSFELKQSTIEVHLNELNINDTLQWQRLENIEHNITWQMCTADCSGLNRNQTQKFSTPTVSTAATKTVSTGHVPTQMTCVDLDTTACVLLHKQKTDLCMDTGFSGIACKRFCGTCRSNSSVVATTSTISVPISSSGCSKDVIFLLDDSGSIGHINFKHAINFVQSIITSLDIGPHNSQVGLLVFGTHPQSVWHLNSHPTKASLLSASNHLHYYGGASRTHEALDYVRTTMLTATHGDRTSVPNVVVVITDGRSTNTAATTHSAQLLHQQSSDVIGIEVANTNEREVLTIATDKNHVFDLRTYASILTIVPNVTQLICA